MNAQTRRIMAFVDREAYGTIAACAAAANGSPTARDVAMASILVGLETGLRAASVDPTLAEVLRDQLIDGIHRTEGADPAGEHHAAAAAMRFLDLAR